MRNHFSFILDEPFLWFCALAGTGLFIIQLILNLMGVGHENVEVGEEIDAGQFKWLSKQALSGFLLMFGWVGLTCRKEFSFSFFLSAVIAGVAGIATIFLNGWIFKMARKLRSTGTIFNIADAIGQEATVYHRIPQGGAGKITLSLHHFTHEIEAISHELEEIPSFSTVYIIQKVDDKTVMVAPKK